MVIWIFLSFRENERRDKIRGINYRRLFFAQRRGQANTCKINELAPFRRGGAEHHATPFALTRRGAPSSCRLFSLSLRSRFMHKERDARRGASSRCVSAFIGFLFLLPKKKERRGGGKEREKERVTKTEKRSRRTSSSKVIKGMDVRVCEYLRPFACLSRRIRTQERCRTIVSVALKSSAARPRWLSRDSYALHSQQERTGDADDNKGDRS